jgi:hypothetical protein
MSMKDIATRAQDGADPLGEKIRDYILGVENIRAENHKLLDQIATLETANLALESEVRSLNLALEHERAERRHYHSLANEIITRLDVVGRTIDDVVKRAAQGVHRPAKENPGPDLPEMPVPSFLRKVEALINGQGEKPESS